MESLRDGIEEQFSDFMKERIGVSHAAGSHNRTKRQMDAGVGEFMFGLTHLFVVVVRRYLPFV